MRTFLIAGLFLWIAGLSHAQPLNLNQAQPPPPHSSNEAKHLKAISKSGEPIEQSPAPLPSNLNVTVGGKLELISETKETKAPEEQQKWLSEFVNVKATDIVLAAFTGLLALYTVFLYKATANLANIARQQESSTKTIERAWVKMSHTEDALIIWDNPTVRMCEITVMVENCGRTPASVTDVRLNICALEYGTTLPTTIDYGKPYPHGAPFLVPGDSFRWHKRTFSLGHLDAPNPVKGEIRLCLFGYVDYIDAFGKSHRAGYAREYLPIQGNNLVFISEPGYNYDRPRETNT